MVSPQLYRAGLCIVALGLLWLSTLRIAVAMVGYVVFMPTLNDVHSTCSYSYDQASDQRKKYRRCANMQMNVCNGQLGEAFQRELRRSVDQFAINSDMLSRARQDNSDVLEGITKFRSLVETLAVGSNSVIISATIECSHDEQLHSQSKEAGMGEIESALLSTIDGYTLQVDERISSLSAYTAELDTYNRNYVMNKTKHLHSDELRALSNVQVKALPLSLANISSALSAVAAAANRLITCIGLSNSTKNRAQCAGGKGVYDMYQDVEMSMQMQRSIFEDQLSQYQRVLSNYVKNVENALAQADRFYDSVSGAKGIISYMLGKASELGVASDLCGHSSPNWCDFSKVSAYIDSLTSQTGCYNNGTIFRAVGLCSRQCSRTRSTGSLWTCRMHTRFGRPCFWK
jgi:hypothetical protein